MVHTSKNIFHNENKEKNRKEFHHQLRIQFNKEVIEKTVLLRSVIPKTPSLIIIE